MSRFGSLPRRLVHVAIVLLGITLVTFFLLRLIPGDPALAILGSSYTHARAQAIDSGLGLNRPIWSQYALFMDTCSTAAWDSRSSTTSRPPR